MGWPPGRAQRRRMRTGNGVGLREGCVHAEFSKCGDEGFPLVLGGLMNTQRWPFVQGAPGQDGRD